MLSSKVVMPKTKKTGLERFKEYSKRLLSSIQVKVRKKRKLIRSNEKLKKKLLREKTSKFLNIIEASIGLGSKHALKL